MFQRALTYDEASEVCEQYGGALASIPNGSINDEVRIAISNLPQSLNNGYYFGLTDRVREGRWMWLDNALELNWSNWNVGEPNGGAVESCAIIRRDGLWNDRSCSVRASNPRPLHFICEKSKY